MAKNSKEAFDVTCIGGTNFDVSFRLEDNLIAKTSNPIYSIKSYGGVIRNVAENMARMDLEVSLMSLVGDDAFGKELIDSSSKLMNVSAIKTVEGETTGTYYSVIDKLGDMAYGFADMGINLLMDSKWINENQHHLLNSKYVVSDLNVSLSAIEALIAIQRHSKIKLAIIGVSGPKMANLPNDLKGLDLLICNLDESQSYFKTDENDVRTIVQMWLDKGIKSVVVTNSKDGSYYGNELGINHQKAFLVEKVVDVTGAGDSFSSAVIYGIINGYSLSEAVKFGSANSSLTIQTPYAVNPDLKIEIIKKEIEKNESR